MVTTELLDKLRAAYKEWHDSLGTSVSTWMALMADGIHVRSVADGAPGMEFSATRRSKDDVYHYFVALIADWEMIHYTAEEFYVEGDRVMTFGHCAFRNRGTGKVAESAVVNRWRFRDGLAVEYFEIYDTAKAFAAATPDPK